MSLTVILHLLIVSYLYISKVLAVEFDLYDRTDGLKPITKTVLTCRHVSKRTKTHSKRREDEVISYIRSYMQI